MDFQAEQQNLGGPHRSLDGENKGDYDQPYRFGWRPRSNVPYPFSTRQYARLLILRSRLEQRRACQDDFNTAA
jgi:hypothetical protein